MQFDSPLPKSTATTSIITTTSSLPPPPQPQQSTTDPILVSCIGELEQHMADMIQNNLAPGVNVCSLRVRFRDLPTVDMKEILQQRMFEDDSYKAHTEARKKRQKRRDVPINPPGSPHSQPPPPPPLAGTSSALGTSGASGYSQLLPPPPPPSTGTSGSAQQQGNKALSSSKTAASTSQSMSWITFDTRYESAGVFRTHELSPNDSLMQDDSIPEEHVHLSNDEDSETDHQSKVDSRKDWWKPLPEKERPATPKPTWTIPSSNKCRSSSVPDGGVSQDAYRSDHVTIQTQFFFNKNLEYLRFGSKGSCPALSISKMKAANYPNFGLKLLVMEQIWIDDLYTYDISAKYGISHWWFTRQKFYIDRHDSPSRQKDVRTHMRILSVVRIKANSRYEYDYLSEIVLRRADHQEHTIAEKDFKNMYPSDFEHLNLLLLQGHLNHLSGLDKRMLSTAVKLWTQNLVIRQWVEDFQLDIESYQTQLNLTKPGWDATGYRFKHDYTIIESPRAVVFPVNNNE
ncbi:hypothetical protein Tco_1502863 [Tanacetum coccineum]